VAGPAIWELDLPNLGDRIRSAEGERPHGYFDLKHFSTGAILQEAPDVPGDRRRPTRCTALTRSASSEAVVANDPACTHLDRDFASLSHESDGVTISFTNGNRVTAGAFIGSDGTASVVGPHLFGPEPVVYAGKVYLCGPILQ